MCKNYLLTLVILLVFSSGQAQINMSLLSNINYLDLHNSELNDIWGYVDETGKEYALVGTNDGTSIVDVSDPTNPSEVFWLPGMNSTWRDLKVWGDYLYVTTEAQEGLTIIDLSPLPGSNSLPVTYYAGPNLADEWKSAHNLYIDEFGFAYIFGANRGNGGVIILDVHTDPTAPIEVGEFDNWYAHDGYVKNNVLYGAHVYDGFFSVVDVSDKTAPVLQGTKETPNFFTHNIWESNDATHVFTTDEVAGAFIGSYDITNTTDIIEKDRIQSSPGSGVIPHNAHVLGDYIVTSYYRDGVTIHDASRPNNLVEVGRFDTSPLAGGGFNGCWGVYPFLPSGNIIASDIEEGLFVLGANYTKGSYLEGIVTDSATGLPLENVKVTIQNEVQTDLSKVNGSYAVSTVQAGNRIVNFKKVGYYEKNLSLNFVNGLLLAEDVELVPLPPFFLTLKVIDQSTNLPINDVQIRMESSEILHEGQTNGVGEEDFTLYYETIYDITVGKWGYITHCENTLIDNSTGTITVALTKGIYDDFTFDFGWNTSATASTGLWERAIPFGGNGSANAATDADYDCSKFAYVTGNAETFDADLDDVDDGIVSLFSPSFDLSAYADPYINYSRYFYNNFGPLLVDDTLRIILLNGSTSAVIEKIGRDTSIFYKWVFKSFRIQDYITPTANMTLLVRTSDLDSNINITEAGFDFFSISNSPLVDVEELESEVFVVFPNPAQELVHVNSIEPNQTVYLFDAKGTLLQTAQTDKTAVTFDIRALAGGFYYVQQGQIRQKFIKN